MFQSTLAESFHSWENFLGAYYEPIRAALGSLPFVGKDLADDYTQSFFLKMVERDFLANRPVITGRFRNWLYAAAKNHAVDEWRKIQRRPEQLDAFDVQEPVGPPPPGQDDTPFDADEFYALSVLHMTVGRVRKHLLEEGKSEHWMIFEELVLAPLIPGRVPKTRDELLAMFPDQAPVVLDNRVTTVKRVFRRILPALVPTDPTENLTAEARFQELLEILRASKNYRLWLAFLIDPAPGPEAAPGFSIDLAARSIDVDEEVEATVSPEVIHDELRILLGFWLEMPLPDYLDDLEGVGPAVRELIRPARPLGRLGRSSSSAPRFNLRALVDGTNPQLAKMPLDELTVLFERLKTFAKRVYRVTRTGQKVPASYSVGRRENSMPFEIAQVLYNLAGALALTRCNARIIGLGDDQYRKNLTWALSQSWLDARLRPVFFAAITQIGRKHTP
jgi:DNA-directed RNA polymerase specialized sigma24 family protein